MMILGQKGSSSPACARETTAARAGWQAQVFTGPNCSLAGQRTGVLHNKEKDENEDLERMIMIISRLDWPITRVSV